MDILVRLVFEEKAAVRLLNWLAQENALFLRQRPDLPFLYDSGVRYEREQTELWSDYYYMLEQGHEDCDALAAARAGELIARGAEALQPRYLADTDRYLRDLGIDVDRWEARKAWEGARRRGLRSIESEVFMLTKTDPNAPGGYHCVVRYRIGRTWFFDDPSARLGMYGRQRLRVDPTLDNRYARPARD
jgi:hypothetical protein